MGTLITCRKAALHFLCSTIRVSFFGLNLDPGLARVRHLHRHWHVVVLRRAWLWHGHEVLLVDVLGHLRLRL